jgi:hypothetical protein
MQMANRIKLAGTSANAFQIGLKGPILGSNNVTSGYQLNLPANVGANAQVLTTDGTGNLSWTTPTGGGGNGTPGGSNTQVQFNDDGNFGGNANFTFNKTTSLLSVIGNISAGNVILANNAGVVYVNNITGLAGQPVVIESDGTEDISLNADTIRIGDNNTNATIATHGTGDLILTTHKGSASEGIIRIFDGANGNISLQPNGTGIVIANSALSATGNVSANFFIGNGSQLTGISGGGGSNIANGTSNVTIPTANGNVIINSNANSTLTITSTNIVVGVGTTGNITGANGVYANLLSANISVQTPLVNATSITATSITGNSITGNLLRGNSSLTIPTANGNITFTAGGVSVANITSTGVNVNGTMNITGTATFNGNANVKITGGSSGQLLTTDGLGNLSWGAAPNGVAIVNGNSNVRVIANGNVVTSVAGNTNVFIVTNNAAVVGTGTGGNITGVNIITGNVANVASITITGNIGNANVITGNTINVSNINVTGISTLGNVGNVRITGGSNNQVLTTNGSGNLNWATPTAATKDYINVRRSAGLAVQTENTTWVFNNLVANSGSITYNTTTGNLLLTSGKVYRIAVNSTEFVVPVGASPEYIQFRWIDDANVQLSAAGMGTVGGDVLGGSTTTLTAGPGTSEFIYAPTATGNIRLATVSGTAQGYTWQRGSLIVQEL